MKRAQMIIRVFTIAAVGVLAACGCTDNPEEGEYCDEIAAPEISRLDDAPARDLSPAAVALMRDALGSNGDWVAG